MAIKSVHLQNFCQHVDRFIEFAPGMTAITGPNGAGKSNVLAGVEYSLLGTDPNVGRLTDSINWGAAKDEFAGVTTVFEHGSAVWQVTRSLRGGTKPLLVCQDTSEVVEGADEVNARILEVLGTTKALVDDYVLVRQGALPAWFYKSSGARSAELAALLGLDDVEKRWKAVGDWLNKVPIAPHTYDTDLTAIADALVVLRRQRQQLEADMPTEPGYADDAAIEAKITQLAGAQHQWIARERVEERIATQEQYLQALTATAAMRSNEHAQAVAVYTEVKQAYDAGKDVTYASLKVMREWETYDASKLLRDQVTAGQVRLTELRNRLPGKPRAADGGTADEYQAKQAQRSDLAIKRDKLEAQRQHRADVRVGHACPTCKQIVAEDSDAALDLATLQQEIATHAAALTELDTWLNTANVTRQTQRAYDEISSQIAQQASDIAMWQAALVEAPEPSVTKDSALSALEQDNARAQQLAAAEKTQQTAQNAWDNTNMAVTMAEQTLRQFVEELAKYVVTKGEYEETLTLMPRLMDLRERRAQIRQQIQHVDADIAAQEKQVGRLQQLIREHAARVTAHTRVSGIRDVLHRDAAPRHVTRRQLDVLTAVTNDVLTRCDVPFTVEATDKFQFLARFPGGVSPDRRLSGGQLALLSLAFRAAMSGTLLQHVGLLVLDEPTGFIDESNLEKLPDVFRSIRDFSAAAGLQLLVVTHEARVMGTFDNVITIS